MDGTITLESCKADFAPSFNSHTPAIKRIYLAQLDHVIQRFHNSGVITLGDMNYDTVTEILKSIPRHSSSWNDSNFKTIFGYFICFLCKYKGLPITYELLVNMMRTTIKEDHWFRLTEKEKALLASEQASLSTNDILEYLNELLAMYDIEHYGKQAKLQLTHVLHSICIFLDLNGIAYTKEAGKIWLEHFKTLRLREYNGFYRSISFLNTRLECKTVDIYCRCIKKKPRIYNLPEWCISEALEYVNLKKKLGYSKNTIEMFSSSVYRFLSYIDSKGIHSFQNIDATIIKDFNLHDMHKTIAGKNAVNSRIRDFLKFLCDNGIVAPSSCYLALSFCSTRTEIKNVSVLTKNEQESAVNPPKEDPLCLRDLAMAELGLRMGIRRIDIVNLTIDNIDWENKILTFIQQKTQREQRLSIPNSTLKALYRYITESRPQNSDKHIFLSMYVPYRPLSPSACNDVMKRVLPDTTSNGFHILRKTFATNALNNGANAEDVKESIGHSDFATVRKYLSLDEKTMRKCALPMTLCGINIREDFQWTRKK